MNTAKRFVHVHDLAHSVSCAFSTCLSTILISRFILKHVPNENPFQYCRCRLTAIAFVLSKKIETLCCKLGTNVA